MLKLMAFTLAAAFLFAIASIIIGRFTATPSSASRFTAGATGFLSLSQSGDRPGRNPTARAVSILLLLSV